MRSRIYAVALAVTIMFTPAWQAKALADYIPVDVFLTDVQKVLVKVRDASDVDVLPPLRSVKLTISVGLTSSAEGTLKFHVIEAGADASSESVQKIILELKPPQASDKSPVSQSIMPLADAIIEAARDVKKATLRDPPLHLTNLEATIDFTVEKQASGSLLFLGAKTRSADTQSISISFSAQ